LRPRYYQTFSNPERCMTKKPIPPRQHLAVGKLEKSMTSANLAQNLKPQSSTPKPSVSKPGREVTANVKKK